jgi:hypothetical protein
MAHSYPFPVATHSYFKVVNKDAQKKLFLSGAIEHPVFKYKSSLTPELIESRIAASNDAVIAARLKLVKVSLELQQDPTKLSAFRAANEVIFLTPKKSLASAIFMRISQKVTSDTEALWAEVLEKIGRQHFDGDAFEPDEAIFQKYRGYLKTYTQLPRLSESIETALQRQLLITGLSEKGWQLKLVPGGEHAHTHHKARTISIGKGYEPRSSSAVRRIATHEVLGHALRGSQASLAESEGFAIVLEQLTKPRFSLRRTYRYLAVALGWGVFGAPMYFRQVYEILWRLMVISSKYSPEIAKQHAFDECYRAFRGGRPDIAGAVFLKDAVYFAANVEMWKVLSGRQRSYNEFVDIIEGRQTVL